MLIALCRTSNVSRGLASRSLVRAASSGLLPVVGVGAVLASEVLVQQLYRDGVGVGVEGDRVERDSRDELQDDGVPGRAHCAVTPREGAVTGHEDRRHVTGISVAEAAAYHEACVSLVVLRDLFGREIIGHRNGTEKIVRVCRAKAGNGFAGLGPRRGELRVGM